MARDVSDSTPIASRDELVAAISAGEKPAHEWRLGVEHEKVPFYRQGAEPVPFAGSRGIEAILKGLGKATDWEPILDSGNVIGLAGPDRGGAVSIEPGGQFELSGAPLETAHDVGIELDRHLAAVKAIANPLGIGFLTLGMSPKWRRAETPVMPKSRYKIMAAYMPKVGTLGLDMMLRTATAQVNLDFSSEADMVRKLRVSLALQPIATALFANSPLTDGKPNGLLSMRSEIWRDTDPDRTGMLPIAFEEGFGYERFVEHALDVPMYFVKRGDTYHDVAGASFRDLLAGKLRQMPGERATQSDWANHLSTLFPEVRLKSFLEMRGADVGPPDHIIALAALWSGLLYDSVALDEASELIREWKAAERGALRDAVPREALRATIAGRNVADVARDVLTIAEGGLKRRARLDATGRNEAVHLAPLEKILDDGRTAAEQVLERYHGAWNGEVDRAFDDYAF